MTIASFVISCLAAVAAVAAAWYVRGQKRAADLAASEAKRSADAAAEVVDIERSRRADEVAERHPPRPVPVVGTQTLKEPDPWIGEFTRHVSNRERSSGRPA
jgi:hypothetical protein